MKSAGMNGEGLILFTMSHEIVHMIREGSPEDYKALNPSERSSFYKSLMPNNQREFYRVGDNAILVLNDSNSKDNINEYKLVFYRGDHVDYEITNVYKISNYEYNIHDKRPNALAFLAAREKKSNEALMRKNGGR